jgi:cytochrome P450
MQRPPSPAGHFISGHLRHFYKNELSFLYKTALEFPVAASMRIFHFKATLFSSPDGVAHILQQNHQNFDKDILDYHILKRVLGNGLLTANGDFWLKQRRTAQPAFRVDRIRAYATSMHNCSRDLGYELHSRRGQVLEVDELMMKVTLRIVGQTLFGQELTGKAADVDKYFGKANSLLIRRLMIGMPAWMITPVDLPLHFATGKLRRIVDEIIAGRSQGEGTVSNPKPTPPRLSSSSDSEATGGVEAPMPNLLDILMHARDPETGTTMSRRQLRDEIMTLMLAGHETTAIALTWTLHLLARHPDVLARVREEIRDLNEEAISGGEQAPYLTWVIEESMRLYPPVWAVTRRTIEADTIMGYDIPAGHPVFVSQYVTHRHPEFWKDPEKFDPERFSPENRKSIPRFAYFPFGGGPRLCIGSGFAMMEARIILYHMLRDFEWETVEEPPTLQPLVTLRPAGGLRLRLLKQRNH